MAVRLVVPGADREVVPLALLAAVVPLRALLVVADRRELSRIGRLVLDELPRLVDLRPLLARFRKEPLGLSRISARVMELLVPVIARPALTKNVAFLNSKVKVIYSPFDPHSPKCPPILTKPFLSINAKTSLHYR